MSKTFEFKDDDLILYLYGEPLGDPAEGAPTRQDLEAALVRSPELSARLADLRRTLALVDHVPTPPLPGGQDAAAYGAAVWRRLEGQLPPAAMPSARLSAADRASRPATSHVTGAGWRQGWQIAAACLLVVGGFLAGRLASPSTPQTPTAPLVASTGAGTVDETFEISPVGRERIRMASLVRHVGASERLFTEVSNSPGRGEAATEQLMAEELLHANRLHRQAALRAGQPRIAALLAELEPIFLELAHGGPDTAVEEVAGLKQRIADGGLLLKLRVTGDRLQATRSDV